MDISGIAGAGGLVLLGCGKMGSALLEGWLKRGLAPKSVWVIEPRPSDWLAAQDVRLNEDLPAAPAIVLVAVKPQMMGDALPSLKAFGGGGTLLLSIAAGTSTAKYEEVFGAGTRIVRAMPNTPAAIGKGITAIVGNTVATADDLNTAEALLSAVGQVVRLDDEYQIDAVTGLSGSGPAYVFHLIESMAAAGEAEGLSRDLSMQLAKATVAGAAALAAESTESPAQLRVNVTSPAGTTYAALQILMNEDSGFPALLKQAIRAATERGRELGRG